MRFRFSTINDAGKRNTPIKTKDMLRRYPSVHQTHREEKVAVDTAARSTTRNQSRVSKVAIGLVLLGLPVPATHTAAAAAGIASPPALLQNPPDGLGSSSSSSLPSSNNRYHHYRHQSQHLLSDAHHAITTAASTSFPRVDAIKARKKAFIANALRGRGTTDAPLARAATATNHHHHRRVGGVGDISSASPSFAPYSCMGEYQQCPMTGECVMIAEDCGKFCGPTVAEAYGKYLCPHTDSTASTSSSSSSPFASVRTCQRDAADCPNIAGTFWDWRLSAEERVSLILQQLNVTEMAAQLTNSAPAIPKLSIPAFQWLADNVHGVNNVWGTSFPSGVTLGQTWSNEHVRRMSEVMVSEARAIHHYFVQRGERAVYPFATNGQGITFYGPNLNLVRDPRWGRNQEVYSEDPFLTGRMTQTMVKQVQQKVKGSRGANTKTEGHDGNTNPKKGKMEKRKEPTTGKGAADNSNDDSTSALSALACCKHFAVYDVEDFPTGRYQNNAVVGARDFWESYMPSFEMCANAQRFGRSNWTAAGHAMCSYNRVNGVPACGNEALLSGVLRGQLRFEGFIVSDYDAWFQLWETQYYVNNLTAAAALGLNAGMDQEGGGSIVIDFLPQAIQEGLTTAAKVETAARRLFRARIDLGLFNPPSFTPSLTNVPFSALCTNDNLKASLKAAEAGIVLLKNADYNSNGGGSTTTPALPLRRSLKKKNQQDKKTHSVLAGHALRAAKKQATADKKKKKKVIDAHGEDRHVNDAGGDDDAVFTVAIIGPTASATVWLEGNYDQPAAWGCVSVLEGMYKEACLTLNTNTEMSGQFIGTAAQKGIDLRYGDATLEPSAFPSVPATSAEQCMQLCSEHLNCNYFTFVGGDGSGSESNTGSKCYFVRDSKTQTPTNRTDIISGSSAGLAVMNYGYSIANTDTDVLSHPPPQDERECSIRCLADVECTAFVFVQGLLGVFNSCFLRPSLSPNNAVANAYAVWGYSPNKCVKRKQNATATNIIDVVKFAPYCLDSLPCWSTPNAAQALAMQYAAESDAVIVVGGLDGLMEQETVDRRQMDLPANQFAMFERVAGNLSLTGGINKPLIAVFVHGGSFLLPPSTAIKQFNSTNAAPPSSSSSSFNAVLTAGYPGMMGGAAIANIIVGNANPSGRTATSWYRSNDDIPYDLSSQSFYQNTSVKNSYGYTYRFFSKNAEVVPVTEQFAVDFGFGLGYVPFSYRNANAAGSNHLNNGGDVPQVITVGKCQTATVTATITNLGGGGDESFVENATEVVQMYLIPPPQKQKEEKERASGVNNDYPSPRLRLVDYAAVADVEPQSSRTVTLTVDPHFMTVVTTSNDIAIQPNIYSNVTRMVFAGEYTLSIGPSQPFASEAAFKKANGFFVKLVVGESYDYDECPVEA